MILTKPYSYTMVFSLESRFQQGVGLIKSLGGKIASEANLIDAGEEGANASITARSQNAIRKVFNQIASNIGQTEGFAKKFRNIKTNAQRNMKKSRNVVSASLLRYYEDFKSEFKEDPTFMRIELILKKGHRLVANSGKLIAMLFSSGNKLDLLV